MVSFIVAVAENGVIGKEGALPWHLPGELALFKEKTMGHPIIMGRKTHEVSVGRTLPGRTNIVISRDSNYKPSEGSVAVTSIGDALAVASASEGSSEIFVIGGAEIYDLAMPHADRLYLTRVKAEVEGDKFFKFNENEWQQISSQKHSKDAKNAYDYEFTSWKRKDS